MHYAHFQQGLAALVAVPIFNLQLLAAAQQTGGDPCEYVAAQQQESIESLSPLGPGDINFASFDAEAAFACINQIPLNHTEAVIYMGIIKEYATFQSTLAYNKNPPESYQQPGVDLMGGLDHLISEVEEGAYSTHYEFEIALQTLIRRVHDGHFSLYNNLYNNLKGLFRYRLSDNIVAISSDGQALPQVYAISDVWRDVPDASPIVEIEGQSVFAYIHNYVNSSRALGTIEPHADWNTLMWNGPLQWGIKGGDTTGAAGFTFTGLELTSEYNGPTLSGRFANGTDFEWFYTASASRDLTKDKLTSARAIRDELIYAIPQVKKEPESPQEPAEKKPAAKAGTRSRFSDELRALDKIRVLDGNMLALDSRQASDNKPANLSAVPLFNYPQDPVVTQEFFGVGGLVSGYILEEDSIGVLSIPTFQAGKEGPTAAASFSKAVDEFITVAKEAGVEKIIIDLSGNGGGTIFQGYDTAWRFFPSLAPTNSNRMRYTRQWDFVGTFLTAAIQDEGEVLGQEGYLLAYELAAGSIPFAAGPWSLTKDGEAWESWDAFYEANEIYGDLFSNRATYNFLDSGLANSYGQDVAGWGANQLTYEAPWAPENVILLHDGFCGSTCTIFSELLKTDVGVRSVAVGGIPQYGPMQGVAGTKGSNVLQWSGISQLMQITTGILSDPEVDNSTLAFFRDALSDFDGEDISSLVPTPLNSSPWAIGGSVNILDQVRDSAPEHPLQFAYEPSDCRLFYTGAMMRDVTQLWRAVGQYMGGDASVCVPGSTNWPGADSNGVVLDGTLFSGGSAWDAANSTEVPTAPGQSTDDNRNNNESTGGDDASGAGSLRVGMGMGAVIAAMLLL
ncbi:hypothetical protein B0I35DRAFT_496319 [Stachybotrys elegans]|uniref:Tail specific protease domain-containing protein n=1 Tax=Stachybotrys elegans TaxID=80388 RepID=A0A8K0SWG2_9HYPO|nr:hypothetical protein B0I35DRAFT_496319 [Stachybotrys elegans]